MSVSDEAEMKRFIFVLLATSSVAPALAQVSAEPPATTPSAGPADSAIDDPYADDEQAIVVVGQKPRGSVIGDIPPEDVLDSRDIRATGATSIAELLDSVSAQTGSARGRSSGRPVVLLDGQRISGFRELRDIPPEAIQRMEILPEEVALKYGYSADQRVVNIVLRERFNSTTAEARGRIATDGGYAWGRLDATKLIIQRNGRASVNARVEGNGPLYEAERSIDFDPASGPDERSARTLVGAGQSARLNATLNRKVNDTTGLTGTAEASIDHGRSRFGLADFDPSSILTRDSTTTSLGLGAAFNSQRGQWRFSSTANADYEHGTSDSDRSLVSALTDDKSRTDRTSFSLDGTANGPIFSLPAGPANATIKVGASRVDLDSRARRRDVSSSANLGRTDLESSINLDVPLAKRDSVIGRLGLNANGGISYLSDFGTLTSVGTGFHWSPTSRLNLITSITREEGAPTLQQLGNPLVETDGVPYFDADRGETVEVTTLTGGNPELLSDRRTVWKIGGNWRAFDKPDLRLRAEFVRERIDNPQVSFPAATPALKAAFPDRFVTDGSGRLVRVDLRPVNADFASRDTVRWGFDFTKQLKSKPPSAAQIQAFRKRLAARMGEGGERSAGTEAARTGPRAGPPQSTQGGTPSEGGPPAADSGARPAGSGELRGGGRGRGGFLGGRNGGRLRLSMTHTITLRDRLDIAPGLPVLDYLDGEAVGSSGGRPRHQVELQGSYYNNGLGARVSADWRSATRVDSFGGTSLRFDDYATVDLRLFANLGERFELVSKAPILRGTSVRFEVTNLFNSRPHVRDAAGITPFAYQPDRLEPLGRTIGISIRKLFIPSRFIRDLVRERREQRGRDRN